MNQVFWQLLPLPNPRPLGEGVRLLPPLGGGWEVGGDVAIQTIKQIFECQGHPSRRAMPALTLPAGGSVGHPGLPTFLQTTGAG